MPGTKIEGYFSLQGGDFSSAGAAATELKSSLTKAGLLAPEAVRRAAVAAFEAEMNVIIHAVAGTLSYEIVDRELRITVRDIGPGIPDVPRAMEEGFTTAPEWARERGWGNGQGLPNMQKNADRLSIETVVGEGTTVVIGISLNGTGAGA
jgi:anti-sigma regulatory factor (Ser/Thr protein kinase)